MTDVPQEPPKDSKSAFSPNIEAKDILKIAFDTRNFEINLFWQRSNYFLVLNSALAIGFVNAKSDNLAAVLAVFGLVVSLLWFRVTLGSKFWQSRWEHRLSEIERRIAPDLDLFSAKWNTIDCDVRNSLENYRKEGWATKWLNNQVMRKHSVSYNMTLLSLLFMVAWLLLAVVRLLDGTASAA